jgi:hypothetical protein
MRPKSVALNTGIPTSRSTAEAKTTPRMMVQANSWNLCTLTPSASLRMSSRKPLEPWFVATA